MTVFIRGAIAALGGLFVYASHEPVGWFIAGIVGTALLYISLAPWGHGSRVGRSGRVAAGPTIAQGMLFGFIHGLTQYLLLLPAPVRIDVTASFLIPHAQAPPPLFV